MALEGSRTDMHPHGPLLVGIPLADQVESFTFALGQGLLASFGRKHDADCALLIPGGADRWLLADRRSPVKAIDLLQHGPDALGLLKRIFHHLLQVNSISLGFRKLTTVLLDLAHIEQ